MLISKRYFLIAISLFFLLSAGKAEAQDYNWLSYYQQAEKAYASQNLFEARKSFMLALREANKCNQRDLLAQKLEDLANDYEAQDKHALAAPLFKLLKKIRSVFH